MAVICVGIAGFLSVGLAACGSVPTLAPQETEGRRLYQARCAHCHEDNDLALKKIPPNLHGVFACKALPGGAPATDEAMLKNVLMGKGTMPAFAGRFTGEQMAALLTYLHTGLR